MGRTFSVWVWFIENFERLLDFLTFFLSLWSLRWDNKGCREWDYLWTETRQADFELLSVTDTQRIFLISTGRLSTQILVSHWLKFYYGRRISIFEFVIFILARLMHIFWEIMTHLEKGWSQMTLSEGVILLFNHVINFSRIKKGFKIILDLRISNFLRGWNPNATKIFIDDAKKFVGSEIWTRA